ncbi:retrovirus-related pol polyprotein from transposon TNT 1-94 [Tanacetum coccineum]
MENLNDTMVKQLRSDNGTEFKSHTLEAFCDEKGISQNFSLPCTPEQNGVAERKNRTLTEAARTIDHLGKFNGKADDGFFLGYSPVAKAFRVFNIRRLEMEETFHVTFSKDDEAISQSSTKGDAINFNEVRSFPDDEFNKPRTSDTLYNSESTAFVESTYLQDDTDESPIDVQPLHQINSPLADSVSDPPIPHDRWSRENHIDLVNIIGEPLSGITTRSKIRDSHAASAFECLYANFLSKIEPKKLIDALEEEGWVLAMTEELNQF